MRRLRLRVAVFHYLHVRAFAHATEDPERVKLAMRHAAGDEAGKLGVEETRVEGSHGNPILILDAQQTSAPATKRVFEALARDDPAGFQRVRAEAPRRLDEHLNFHLRLDKQEAYAGRLALAADEDAITLRGKIRSFEAKRSADPLAASAAEMASFLDGVARRVSP